MNKNEIQEYFQNLDTWQKNTNPDYIKELSQTIKVFNPAIWEFCLKKWLVAVVANVINEVGCQNNTCLVLTGLNENCKSTWLENLYPKELHKYCFTGKINPHKKELLYDLAELLFINIDNQLNRFRNKSISKLHNLISVPSIKYRKVYTSETKVYPRIASFCASVGEIQYFKEVRSPRRFLPFEVDEIDIKAAQKININDVWKQAYSLYNQGFRYSFCDTEIQEIQNFKENYKKII